MKLHCPKCRKDITKDHSIYKNSYPHKCKICKTRIKFACLKCDKMYLGRESIVKHNRIVHGNATKYECAHCYYNTYHKKQLRSHIHRNHYFEDLFEKCPNCGKSLKHLSAHLRRQTCAYENPVKFQDCKKCKKNFKNLSSLEKHTQMCGKKLYYCDFCKVKFHMKHQIRLHLWKCHMFIRA